MSINFGASDKVDEAPIKFGSSDAVDESRPLPAGVKPSDAGAGRGGQGGPTADELARATVGPDRAVQVYSETLPGSDELTDTRTILERPSIDRSGIGFAQRMREDREAEQRAAKWRTTPRRDSIGPAGRAQSLQMDVAEMTPNPVARGAVAGLASLGKVGTGAVRLAADLVGADDVEQFARGAAGVANATEQGAMQGLGGNEKLVADVTSSILNSVPSLTLGVAGGPALRGLFVQSALQEYNAGRDAGFDAGESLARAGIIGTAEALGERFGFSEQIQLLKAAARNLPQNELARVVGSLLIKEIPGEQLTTAIQFAADKLGPAALNPNATIEDYLNAAGDTLKVTIGQMAVMSGGPAAIATGREVYRNADAAPALPAIPPEAPPRPVGTPYERAQAVGFHVDPPLSTDSPQVQRKKTDEIFAGVAAMYGIPPKMVALAREASEGRPLRDLGAFYRRFVGALQRRGLAPEDIAPEALDALEHGAVPPPPEETADPPGAAPAAPAAGAAPAAAVSRIEDTLRSAGALADAAPSAIDTAAHAAATSPLNDLPEPSNGQAIAGNYKLGHDNKTFPGLDLSIENPAGSVRKDKNNDPPKWQTEMVHHYGYIRGSVGADKDHVDVFVKPGTAAGYTGPVFVVDQRHRDGRFDEHKVMLGFDNEEEARAAYLSNYDEGWTGLKAITAMPYDEFRAWVFDPTQTTKEAAARDQASDEGNAGVPGVAARQVALQQPEGQGVPSVRGAGNQGGPRVGERLSSVLPRTGSEAIAAALAGSDQGASGLPTRQRSLGDEGTAGPEQAAVRAAADRRRSNDDRGGVGARDRPAGVDDLRAPQRRQEPGRSAGEREEGGRVAPSAPDAGRQDRLDQGLGENARPGKIDAPPEDRTGLVPSTRADDATLAPSARRTEARGTAKHPQTVMGSRLLAIVSASRTVNGLSLRLLSEYSERVPTGRRDRNGFPLFDYRNPLIPGVGKLFRAGGTEDRGRIAELLEDHGYLAPGEVAADHRAASEKAKDLIRAALNREEPLTLDQQVAEQAADDERQREAYHAEQAAEAEQEAQAEREAIMAEAGLTTSDLAALTDDQVESFETLDTAAGMRALGFTEQEIADELAQEANRRAEAGAAEARAPGSDAAAAADAARSAQARPDEEGLTSYSAEDLREREEARGAAVGAERRRKAGEQQQLQREADERANRKRADDTVDDFQLGQTAEQQMSGMGDLFADEPAPARARPRPDHLIELRKRLSVLESLRACLKG